MANFRIEPNDTFSVDVTVKESDEYTKTVYLRFDRHYGPEQIESCNEMFLTPSQLDHLGRFLIRQAEEIKTAQDQRGLRERLRQSEINHKEHGWPLQG